MTHLYNDPADFADELADGFAAANERFVRRVPGGVVRARKAPAGTVSVVIGGGSGHYPAFAGLVGSGLAAGAAMGNLFASPSAQQIYSVAKAADTGGGILFSYGNYAGDVLNFDQAQERLIEEGIQCRTVVVTDDIYSSPPSDTSKRRGIAGGLVVYKVAGAAADAAMSLDDVVRVATAANDRTRSIGVAFSGCTLPGASAPLFTVPEGRMAIGLGIHGEPGVEEVDSPTADGLAELFVGSLSGEVPAGVQERGARVALILNGLGSVKYEELFVVYRRIAALLGERAVTVVDPEVGEMVTSFDMAGASLSLCWLNDELERLWTAPALTPAYTKAGATNLFWNTGNETPKTPKTPKTAEGGREDRRTIEVAEASDQSRSVAPNIVRALESARAAIEDAADQLGHYDAIAGDGDHGVGMLRGISAALDAARQATERGAGAGTVISLAGDAWAYRGGGTSGALWGVALRAAGARIGDTEVPDARGVAAAASSARAEIERVGKAKPGDKTMLDAIDPFVTTLEEAALAGETVVGAWSAATASASTAAVDSARLVPRIGRSRLHAEKSVGTPDPGAASFAIIVDAVLDAIKQGPEHG